METSLEGTVQRSSTAAATITERAFDFLLPIRFTFMDEQQTISVKEGLKEQHTTYDRYGEIAGFGTMLLGTTTGISVAKGGIRNHKHRDSCRSREGMEYNSSSAQSLKITQKSLIFIYNFILILNLASFTGNILKCNFWGDIQRL